MNTEGLTKLREYIRKDKPKAVRKDFELREPLTWGWMLPYLLGLDDIAWGRWEYWAQTNIAGRLLPQPIPQISWAGEHGEERSYCAKCDAALDNGPICRFLNECRQLGMTQEEASRALRLALLQQYKPKTKTTTCQRNTRRN